MATPFAWRCPFCGHHATIGDENHTQHSSGFLDGNKYGLQLVVWHAITCPNPACREYALSLVVRDAPPKAVGQLPVGRSPTNQQ